MNAIQKLKSRGLRFTIPVAAGVLVLGGGLGGVGYAVAASGGVHVCAAAHTGALRAAGKCATTEKALVLSAGARGLTGKTGKTGAPGAPGAPGAAGAAGANGTAKAYVTVSVDAQGNPTLLGSVGFTDVTKPSGVNSNIYCLYVAASIPLTEPLFLTSLLVAQGDVNVAALDVQASAQQCHGAYEVLTLNTNGNPIDTASFNVLIP
jgi:hypothetical protein